MDRERKEFVLLLVAAALWAGTAIAVPASYWLLTTGHFAADCPDSVAGFVEHWNEYTVPRRMFAVFMCVELILTRGWCLKEFVAVLQSLLLDVDQRARVLLVCYLWAATVTSVILDTVVLAWVFFNDRVCSELLADRDNVDFRKLRTLEPLCIQTSDVEAVMRGIHICNTMLLLAVTMLITVLAHRASRIAYRFKKSF